jgi:glycosyltransferase involved in cell wall biosynthesis
MPANERPRVAIVASHPIQHFCPLYTALAADGRIQLKVFFGSTAGVRPYYDPDFAKTIQWAGTLLDGYDSEFLPGADAEEPPRGVEGRGLGARLRAWDPDAVHVNGFGHGISRRGFLWARTHGRKALFFSDSELRTRRRWSSRARKRLMLPVLFSLVDAFVTIGDRNEEYYRFYGVRPDRFFRSPIAVDTPLLDCAWHDRQRRRRRLRAELQIDDTTMMALVVGKLTTRKRPADAVRAVARAARATGRPIVAVLAGDGPERPALEALADEVDRIHVRLPGFVNTDLLADYYVSADLLVHPSEEDPHPLATTEAVYCGLPVIVSDRVGSVGPTDDVRIGENGREYPVGDVDALAGHITQLATDASLRACMSARSRAIGQRRMITDSVDGFVRAAYAVCDNGRMRRRAR